MLLVAGIAVALVWANVHDESYEAFWSTTFSIQLGGAGISLDLREWVNRGLMTFFFLVVGLEARREFDLGDLRERRRFVLPLVAGLAGMGLTGWHRLGDQRRRPARMPGVATSTDTALALGLLALLGRDIPDRMRVFVLTVFVVDDLVALAVIALSTATTSRSFYWRPLWRSPCCWSAYGYGCSDGLWTSLSAWCCGLRRPAAVSSS